MIQTVIRKHPVRKCAKSHSSITRRNTELARAVDLMMAQAKRIYILMIKINEGFNCFSSQCFLKEIENMFSVCLSSYRNTRESLESCGNTHLSAHVPTASLILSNFHLCFSNLCFSIP